MYEITYEITETAGKMRDDERESSIGAGIRSRSDRSRRTASSSRERAQPPRAREEGRSKEDSKIRFRDGKQDECYQRIRQRVAEHFSQTGRSRYANTTVVLKAALFGSLAVTSYGLIVANILSAWSLLTS